MTALRQAVPSARDEVADHAMTALGRFGADRQVWCAANAVAAREAQLRPWAIEAVRIYGLPDADLIVRATQATAERTRQVLDGRGHWQEELVAHALPDRMLALISLVGEYQQRAATDPAFGAMLVVRDATEQHDDRFYTCRRRRPMTPAIAPKPEAQAAEAA